MSTIIKSKVVIIIAIILSATLVLLSHSVLSQEKKTVPAPTPITAKKAAPLPANETTSSVAKKVATPAAEKEKVAPKEKGEPAWSPDKVMKNFWTLDFWLLILFAIVWGAIGGLVYELLILQGNIEKPHKLTETEIADKLPYAIPAYLYDLGFVSRIIIGAAAAVAALWVIQPSALISLGAVSLIAGSAGSSILRSMQDRLTTALTGQKLAETSKKVDKQKEKLNQLESTLTKLKDDLVTKSKSPVGQKSLSFDPNQFLDLSELEKAENLLSEIRGIGDTM
jgi:hypothetical protein